MAEATSKPLGSPDLKSVKPVSAGFVGSTPIASAPATRKERPVRMEDNQILLQILEDISQIRGIVIDLLSNQSRFTEFLLSPSSPEAIVEAARTLRAGAFRLDEVGDRVRLLDAKVRRG